VNIFLGVFSSGSAPPTTTNALIGKTRSLTPMSLRGTLTQRGSNPQRISVGHRRAALVLIRHRLATGHEVDKAPDVILVKYFIDFALLFWASGRSAHQRKSTGSPTTIDVNAVAIDKSGFH